MKLFAGAWCGATLAAVLCIAYNTSANVSVLEGAQRHLTFKGVVAFTLGGAAAGFLVAAVVMAVAASARATKQLGDQQ